MKNVGWGVLCGSAVRIILYCPEIGIWILFAVLLGVIFIRPLIHAISCCEEEE